MTGKKDGQNRKLIDRLTADPRFGARLALLGTTYEFDPEFFEIDFLPTLLDLGAWDDRSWTSRIAVEKALSELDAATIVADARCYRGRPRSFRVELLPCDVGAGAKLHAKVLFIVHEDAVRLVVGSANLTENGYRMNREIAAVIDATPKDAAASSLILDALDGFGSVLKQPQGTSIERVLETGRRKLESWAAYQGETEEEWFQWSGGTIRLWSTFLNRWPFGETIERITIVSPFWSAEEKGGPIELFLRAVSEIGGPTSSPLILRLMTEAKAGPDGAFLPSFGAGLPNIPTDIFPLEATAHAVDPSVSRDEVDVEGFSASRSLHAKVVLLEGRNTSLAYLGSANFSRRGWGFGGGPANVEAGIILRRSGRHRQLLRDLIPATVGEPVVLIGAWEKRVNVEALPPDDMKWPSFILSVRLVTADGSSDRLDLEIEVDKQKIDGAWSAHYLGGESDNDTEIALSDYQEGRRFRARLEPTALERLLRDKEILIRWLSCPEGRAVPLNVAYEARDALPIAPGADRPGEALLLEYYQGRISFEELFPAPLGEVVDDESATSTPPSSGVDTSRIQSYQIREFVEALPGIIADLSAASTSGATIRLALLGPVSPLALAREIARAVNEQRRTAVAAAFQIVEILGCLFQAQKLSVPERHAENWEKYCTGAILEIERILSTLKTTFPGVLSPKSSFARYETMLRRAHGGEERVA